MASSKAGHFIPQMCDSGSGVGGAVRIVEYTARIDTSRPMAATAQAEMIERSKTVRPGELGCQRGIRVGHSWLQFCREEARDESTFGSMISVWRSEHNGHVSAACPVSTLMRVTPLASGPNVQ
jgi:hypothetical protein